MLVAQADRGAGTQERFAALPMRGRAYVAGVCLLGLVLLGSNLFTLRLPRPALFLELLALAFLSSAVKIVLPLSRGSSSLSLSYPINLAAVLVLNHEAAVLIALVGAWSQCTFFMRAPNPLYRTLFSMASLVVTVYVTGLCFEALNGAASGSTGGFIGLLLAVATTYFAVNTGLVALAVAWTTRQPSFAVWRENFLWSAPSYFIGAAAAGLAATVAKQETYWWWALSAIPVYLTFRSYRMFLSRIEDEQAQVRRMSEVHLATTEALALAIEAKDLTSRAHIRRLQRWARELAKATGMPDEEVLGLETAALLHDIGNLAVPEHILAKPGPLTFDEFDKVKIHPVIGAHMLQGVPFPYPVAPLVLSHHEHWDGGGYPSGLKGADIPAGARVLAVVDTYTSLISDRPYRPAVSPDQAVLTLRRVAGSALDPVLTEAFIGLLPRLSADPDEPVPVARPATGFDREVSADVAAGLALKGIAVAQHEVQVLYEIAQALGSSRTIEDAMKTIASKLASLVPAASCALFLFNEDTGQYACRHVTGVHAPSIWPINAPDLETLGGIIPADGHLPGEGAPLRPHGLRSALVSPLQLNDRALGALAVYSIDADAYTGDHRRLLARVSQQTATVIYNTLLFDQMQQASLTDALTALPNRRSLLLHADVELTRAERRHIEVAFMMIDIDDFKAINDTYGHAVGDRALREVGAVLRSSLRPHDLCARHGGDEFVVVLWDCGAEEATRKGRALQAEIGSVRFEAAPGRMCTLSGSVGAATCPADGTTTEALIAVADERMYRDKASRKRPRRLSFVPAPTSVSVPTAV